MQSSSHYYLVLLQIVLLLASSAFIIYLWMLVYKKRKQEAIKKLPFTEEYESILSHIKLYKELTGQEKQKIHESILFLSILKSFKVLV